MIFLLESSEEVISALEFGRALRSLGERGLLAAVDAVLVARPPASNFELRTAAVRARTIGLHASMAHRRAMLQSTLAFAGRDLPGAVARAQVRLPSPPDSPPSSSPTRVANSTSWPTN